MTLPDDLYDEYLPPPPTLAGLRRVIEAVVRAATADIDDHILAIEENLTLIGENVATFDESVADLRGAIGEVINKLDEMADEMKATDATRAAQLGGLAEQLRAAVANPDLPDEEPVEPTPEPDPDQPA